eukprot:scaffold25722_cov109-Isochrysis_galbana.AAC.8
MRSWCTRGPGVGWRDGRSHGSLSVSWVQGCGWGGDAEVTRGDAAARGRERIMQRSLGQAMSGCSYAHPNQAGR